MKNLILIIFLLFFSSLANADDFGNVEYVINDEISISSEQLRLGYALAYDEGKKIKSDWRDTN